MSSGFENPPLKAIGPGIKAGGGTYDPLLTKWLIGGFWGYLAGWICCGEIEKYTVFSRRDKYRITWKKKLGCRCFLHIPPPPWTRRVFIAMSQELILDSKFAAVLSLVARRAAAPQISTHSNQASCSMFQCRLYIKQRSRTSTSHAYRPYVEGGFPGVELNTAFWRIFCSLDSCSLDSSLAWTESIQRSRYRTSFFLAVNFGDFSTMPAKLISAVKVV